MAGNKIPLVCEHCKRTFFRYPSEARKAQRHFCSPQCSVASRGTLEQRFWTKVNRSPGQGPKGDCWEWQGSKNVSGYGFMYRGGKVPRDRVRTSHVSVFLATGRWPELLVCHSCDNPPCVNPEHLWEGTNDLNQRDKIAKGRQAKGLTSGPRKHPERMARGEAQPISKLTREAVLETRRLFPNRRRGDVIALARRFGVNPHAIYAAGKGITWRHVAD